MKLKCIVCKEPTDKFDPDFQAGFCEGADCIEQLDFGWDSIEIARTFYRQLYLNEDGSTRETPLSRMSVKVGDKFHLVRAAWYKK